MDHKKTPWACPFEECGYSRPNRLGRAAHLSYSHGIASPVPSDDGELLALAAQKSAPAPTIEGLAAQVLTLTKEVKALTPGQDPVDGSRFATLQEVVAHCEGGQCPAHAKEWEDLKTQIVEAAYENMPPELVETKALELNLIPKTITFAPS